ncbi:hypothetical protein NKDENANG_03434 [Candidatus Entotheonellaceae bacterium PAL068K]
MKSIESPLYPKIAIPMHYQDHLGLVRRFTYGFPTTYLAGNTLESGRVPLPSGMEMIVMRPSEALE